MCPEVIAQMVRENIGKKIKAMPLLPAVAPSILLIQSVDEEGFTCYDFSDPALIDPTVLNYAQFWDISEVLLENSN